MLDYKKRYCVYQSFKHHTARKKPDKILATYDDRESAVAYIAKRARRCKGEHEEGYLDMGASELYICDAVRDQAPDDTAAYEEKRWTLSNPGGPFWSRVITYASPEGAPTEGE